MSQGRLNLALFLGILLTPLVMYGQEKGEGLLNRLLAPGPLMEGHKEFEKSECLKCHETGQGVPNSKCLDCHKEIQKQILGKRGFHGLKQDSCIQCHSDHKGRANDTTQVSEKSFDHRLTGFELQGKHASIACKECHSELRHKKLTRKQGIHFFGSKASCNQCHKKEDVHKFVGKFAEQSCSTCHGLNSWKNEIRFDHAETGHYKLVGKHAELKCAECHRPNLQKPSKYHWEGLSQAKCLACHTDVHKKHFSQKFSGPKCTTCHGQDSWKISDFKHEQNTGYKLEGAHHLLKCLDCHKQSKAAVAQGPSAYHWAGQQQKCVSCHKDPHKNNLGQAFKSQRCDQCHTQTQWQVKQFDHKKLTGFNLGGSHAKLECKDCHKQSPNVLQQGLKAYHWGGLKTSCLSCHGDYHGYSKHKNGKLLNCQSCHNDQSWKQIHGFNHNKDTPFVLDGKHADMKCNECHIGKNAQKVGTYFWPKLKEKSCEACHSNPHLGVFKPELLKKRCTECHTTSSWRMLVGMNKNFNHDKDTRFALTGSHKELNCKKCHQVQGKSIYKFENADQKFCTSCHANVHKDQFSARFNSKACTECHNTVKFSERLNFNHLQTGYAIKGKHADLSCEKCHTDSNRSLPTIPPKPAGKYMFAELAQKNCATCHKDVHKGGYGGNCSECHEERGWKYTKDFHRNFTLKGAHFSLQCNECHVENRRLAGMSQNCKVCHQKDDVHHGALPNCGDCHLQHFWENAEFKHSLTQFPLRGVHRTLDCAECHARGVYRSTPSQCMDCHLRDASSASFPVHTQPQFQNCKDCHNQFSFK